MPSSKSYKRDYRQELKTSKQRGEDKDNVLRHAARREMVKQGKAHKGDGKDVDHKKALDSGGSNSSSNFRVVDVSKNRSFLRNSKGSLISQTSRKERRK